MAFADVRGARLYYESHGDGDPLLLHPGFGGTVEIYWANVRPLSERFRVVVFDPRGAGRSDPAEPSATMRDFADDAAGLLDALEIESAHVFAMSFGGMVAQHIAINHAGRVRRLVLGCTAAGGACHVAPPPANMVRFMASSSIADPAEAVRSTYALNYSEAYTDEHDGALVERARANAHLRSREEHGVGQLNAVQRHDTREELHKIGHATLVPHGTDDGTVPFANGRTLAAAIPNARLSTYEGARHLFFVECAERLNREVAEFLTAPTAPLASK